MNKMVNGVVVAMTQQEIDDRNTEIAEAEAEQLANGYKEERRGEYPSIGDQLDALFHAGVFPNDMADKIQAVKNAHPKP